MASAPIIALQDVHYRWPGRAGFSISVPSFSVNSGQTVLLLGDSGSGKSTLLSLICGTILPDSGQVRVADTPLQSLPGRHRDRFRAENIGVIFQQFNLLPFVSVSDNILLPLRFAPARRKRCGQPARQAADLCRALGLPDGVGALKAAHLSVGQQQRVAVARALIGQPPLLVADEPTSALDENARTSFLDLVFQQVQARRTTFLMVSHDPRLADRFDRTVRIDEIARVTRAAA